MSISLGSCEMNRFSLIERILHAVQEHPKLKVFDVNRLLVVETSEVFNEVRAVEQIVRHRRVLLSYGNLSFFYGNCVSKDVKYFAVALL